MRILDALIEGDEEKIRESRRAFPEDMPEAFHTAASMYTTFLRGLRRGREGSGPAKEEPTAFEVRAYLARVQVAALLQPQFMWAATDLFRTRLTAMLGYRRQQAEGLALLSLMRKDAKFANRWYSVRTLQEGKAFYKEFHKDKIIPEVNRLGLSRAYELGSASSLHVRFGSLVFGLRVKRSRQNDAPLAIFLAWHEVNPEDPFPFLWFVISFLETQAGIFAKLEDVFPNAADPIWSERVRQFRDTVDRLWHGLRAQFPDRIQKIQEAVESY